MDYIRIKEKFKAKKKNCSEKLESWECVYKYLYTKLK